MAPHDRFNQLLPVAPTRKKEHEAEGPDEVTAEEENAIATSGRSTLGSLVRTATTKSHVISAHGNGFVLEGTS